MNQPFVIIEDLFVVLVELVFVDFSRARTGMKEVREKRMSLGGVVLMAASDPFGLFCFFLIFGKFWKVGLILLTLILIAGLITGFVILWIKHWDI